MQGVPLSLSFFVKFYISQELIKLISTYTHHNYSIKVKQFPKTFTYKTRYFKTRMDKVKYWMDVEQYNIQIKKAHVTQPELYFQQLQDKLSMVPESVLRIRHTNFNTQNKYRSFLLYTYCIRCKRVLAAIFFGFKYPYTRPYILAGYYTQ